MATYYCIPLTKQGGRTLSTSLGDVAVYITTKWNSIASAWVIDIYDANNLPMIEGVMLVSGVDLLKPYTDLKALIGGLKVIELNPGDYETLDYLGSQVQLQWFPVGEAVV